MYSICQSANSVSAILRCIVASRVHHIFHSVLGQTLSRLVHYPHVHKGEYHQGLHVCLPVKLRVFLEFLVECALGVCTLIDSEWPVKTLRPSLFINSLQLFSQSGEHNCQHSLTSEHFLTLLIR